MQQIPPVNKTHRQSSKPRRLPAQNNNKTMPSKKSPARKKLPQPWKKPWKKAALKRAREAVLAEQPKKDEAWYRRRTERRWGRQSRIAVDLHTLAEGLDPREPHQRHTVPPSINQKHAWLSIITLLETVHGLLAMYPASTHCQWLHGELMPLIVEARLRFQRDGLFQLSWQLDDGVWHAGGRFTIKAAGSVNGEPRFVVTDLKTLKEWSERNIIDAKLSADRRLRDEAMESAVVAPRYAKLAEWCMVDDVWVSGRFIIGRQRQSRWAGRLSARGPVVPHQFYVTDSKLGVRWTAASVEEAKTSVERILRREIRDKLRARSQRLIGVTNL